MSSYYLKVSIIRVGVCGVATPASRKASSPRESLTASRQASSIQGERPEDVNSERVPRAPGERSEPAAVAFMGRPYKKKE